jgi:hypothetical protein
MHDATGSSWLVGLAPLTAAGGVVALIYLVFVIYCAVVTFRKGHYLLFILGFFCGICWIIGLLSAPKGATGPGLDEHYVPPPPMD